MKQKMKKMENEMEKKVELIVVKILGFENEGI